MGPANLGGQSGAGSKEEKSKDKLAGRCFTFLGSLGRRGLKDLEEGGADLEEEGADFELAAKETPVELTTWLEEGGADFVEEGADLEEEGADLEEGGADLEEGGAFSRPWLPQQDRDQGRDECLLVQCGRREAPLFHMLH